MSADPIQAVPEAEATGETARLFAALRETLGVPFVNLIWRHLATIPGGLGWAWALLEPVYRSPVLGQSADALLAGVVPPRGALPPCVLDAAGVGARDRQVVAALLADYNRANALNFLALSLAGRVLAGMALPDGAAPPAASGPSPAPAPRPPTLPPLPGLDSLEPALRALVLELDRFGRAGQSDAVASLYRHLAHWPGFLALAHTALSPFHADGSLRRQGEAVIADAQPVLERQLRPLLGRAPPPLKGEPAARVRAGLDQFTRLMIARMTVMGTAMLALLPAEPG